MLKPVNRVVDTQRALESPTPLSRHVHRVTIFPSPEPVERPKTAILLALAISFGSFTVAFLTANNPALTVAYDSGHYLGSTQMLVATILSFFHQITPEHAATVYGTSPAALGQHLLLDGPVLPGIGAVVFTFLGHVPQGADWRTLVAFGSFTQACSTALVFYLALRLSARKLVASAAALLWALYPPAVLSCNSFVSEPVITTLLLAAVACLERIGCAPHLMSSKTRNGLALIAGAAMTCVFISKPALAPLLILTTGFALWFARRSLMLVLVSLLLGMALIEAPWVAYTESMGNTSIASRRAPAVNIVKGSDVTADGWNTFPETQLAKSLLPSDQPLTAYATIAAAHPAQLANLTIRKVERLCANPWNDFRAPFILPVSGQIWWHRLLLISGVVGLMTLLAQRSKTTSANFLVACGVATIACHAIYLPFEACPRYAFSAMPLLVVLAASLLGRKDFKNLAFIALGALVAILCSLDMAPFCPNLVGVYPLAMALECAIKVLAVAGLGMASANHYKKWGAIASTAIAGIWIMILVAHLFNPNESREYRTVVKPGHSIVQQVPSGFVAADRWTLLLIDGSYELESSAKISVNGHAIPMLVPLSSFGPVHFNLNRNFYEYAGHARKAPNELRQWRATYVPNDFLKPNGENTVTVHAQSERVTVYGAMPNLTGNLVIPSTDYFGPALQFFKGQPLELRTPSELIRTTRLEHGVHKIFFLTGVNPPVTNASPAEQLISQSGSNSISITELSSQLHTRVTVQGNVQTPQPIVVFLSAKLGTSEFLLPGSPMLVKPSIDGSFSKEIVIPPGIAASLTATLSANSSSIVPHWTVSTRSEHLPLIGLGQAILH